MMRRILIATSNAGKLRDFAGAASAHEIEIASVPDFSSIPSVVEDGMTFEANARKKAESYSLHVPGEIVLADDSGLEVDALGGAPGVYSARYAAQTSLPHLVGRCNTDDQANNARLIRELRKIPRRNVPDALYASSPRPATARPWRYFGVRRKAFFWTSREGRTDLGTILFSIFRRSRKLLPS